MNITILGAGNMGTALAKVAGDKKHNVVLWSIEPDVVTDINGHHQNSKYLKGIALPKTVSATSDLGMALKNASLIVFAVPSHVLESVAVHAAGLIQKNQYALVATKGIEQKFNEIFPAVIGRVAPKLKGRVAQLAGPAIASEFSSGTPTAVVVAHTAVTLLRHMHEAFETDAFRISDTKDIVGASWCAMLKNVYALALGMCDGMKYVMNTKSILVTQGLHEMALIVARAGGKPETVYGLAGVGDLITTGFSEHGRNRKAGEMICTENACDLSKLGATMTIEGIPAAKCARAFAKKYKLKLPLLEMLGNVLFDHQKPREACHNFMAHYPASK